MFMQRAALTAARRAAVPVARRTFATSLVRCEAPKNKDKDVPAPQYKTLSEVRTRDDLFGPGAPVGTVPTDLNQSTGIERLEILGKVEGVDVFDMRPLDASRKGTVADPILVRSAGDEQFAGCTGFPADSHNVIWVGLSRDRPVDRCSECGNVYKMDYVGPEDDGHGHHDHHGYEEPKTFVDFVKPEYH